MSYSPIFQILQIQNVCSQNRSRIVSVRPIQGTESSSSRVEQSISVGSDLQQSSSPTAWPIQGWPKVKGCCREGEQGTRWKDVMTAFSTPQSNRSESCWLKQSAQYMPCPEKEIKSTAIHMMVSFQCTKPAALYRPHNESHNGIGYTNNHIFKLYT